MGAEDTKMSDQIPRTTHGVASLRADDPRRAIRRLALPTAIAMSVQTLYNLVDAIWVARLGADPLAAVGLFFPFMFVAIALATGIGVGGGSAVSRSVGANDQDASRAVAAHSVLAVVVAAMLYCVPLALGARGLFVAIGAGSALEPAVSYGRVMFAGMGLVLFSHVAMALLRGEGDARRPMVAMVIGATMNIVLDPILIFEQIGPIPGMGLGVAGAAWASVASMAVSAGLLAWWLLLAGDAYVTPSWSGFRLQRWVVHEIARVGAPASVQHLAMASMMFLFNGMLVALGGTDAVAVFSTGWRVLMVAVLPVMGLTTAVVAVTGAAYGMGDLGRLRRAYLYAVRLGITMEIVAVGVLLTGASPIAAMFTFSGGAASLHEDLVAFLRTVAFFLPAVPLGMCSSGMFQGIRRGVDALAVTLLRTLVLAVPLAYLFGTVVFGDPQGVYVGLVIANLTAGGIGFWWALRTIRQLPGRTRREQESGAPEDPVADVQSAP